MLLHSGHSAVSCTKLICRDVTRALPRDGKIADCCSFPHKLVCCCAAVLLSWNCRGYEPNTGSAAVERVPGTRFRVVSLSERHKATGYMFRQGKRSST